MLVEAAVGTRLAPLGVARCMEPMAAAESRGILHTLEANGALVIFQPLRLDDQPDPSGLLRRIKKLVAIFFLQLGPF